MNSSFLIAYFLVLAPGDLAITVRQEKSLDLAKVVNKMTESSFTVASQKCTQIIVQQQSQTSRNLVDSWQSPAESPVLITSSQLSNLFCRNHIFVVDKFQWLVDFMEANRKHFTGNPSRYAVIFTGNVNQSLDQLFQDNKSFLFKLDHFAIYLPKPGGFQVYVRRAAGMERSDFMNGKDFLLDSPLFRKDPVNDYQGRHLAITIVGTNTIPFFYKVNHDKNEGEDTIYEGHDAKLVQVLAKDLGFSYTIITPSDGYTWGHPFSNGSGVGNVGMLMRQDADIAPSHFVKKYPEAGRVTEFTASYNVLRVCFLIKKPTYDSSSQRNALLKPLDLAVWIGLLISFFVVSFVLVIFMGSQSSNRKSLGLLNLLAMVLEENMPSQMTLLQTQHARVLVGSFLISTLIITSGYKGTLKSFLIAKEVPKPIDSIEQLNRAILNQGVRPIFQGFFYQNQELKSRGSKYDTIVKHSVSIGWDLPWNKIWPTFLANGKGAMFTTDTELTHRVSDYDSEGKMMGHIFGCVTQYYTGIMTQLDSPYKAVLSDRILKLTAAGLVDRWIELEKDKHATKRRRLNNRKHSKNDKSASLNMSHLQSPFYYWLACVFGSSLVFFIESFIVYFNWN